MLFLAVLVASLLLLMAGGAAFALGRATTAPPPRARFAAALAPYRPQLAARSLDAKAIVRGRDVSIGRADDDLHWDVVIAGVRIAERTTFTVLARQNPASADLREIELGAPALDATYVVAAADDAVARAALRDVGVVRALDRLFERAAGSTARVEVTRDGTLACSVRCDDAALDDPSRVLEEVVALAERLDDVAHIAPISAPPRRAPLAAVGADSGSPVVVALGLDRR